MAKTPFQNNNGNDTNNRRTPLSSLSVQSYHADSPPFVGLANDDDLNIPSMNLNDDDGSNNNSNNESNIGDNDSGDNGDNGNNDNNGNNNNNSTFLYSPRPDGSTQPTPNPMLSDLPSSAANALASRAVRPSAQRESSSIGVARDRVPEEPLTAPSPPDSSNVPITPNPLASRPPSPSVDLIPDNARQFYSNEDYVFPKHKLKGMMEDESKIPLVIVACGSFSPPTYLHLRMFEMASDQIREKGKFEILGGYYSPVYVVFLFHNNKKILTLD